MASCWSWYSEGASGLTVDRPWPLALRCRRRMQQPKPPAVRQVTEKDTFTVVAFGDNCSAQETFELLGSRDHIETNRPPPFGAHDDDHGHDHDHDHGDFDDDQSGEGPPPAGGGGTPNDNGKQAVDSGQPDAGGQPPGQRRLLQASYYYTVGSAEVSNITYFLDEGVELVVTVPKPGPYFICYKPFAHPIRTLQPFGVYEAEFSISTFFQWSAPFFGAFVLCLLLWLLFHGKVIGGYSLIDATIYGMKLGNRNCLLGLLLALLLVSLFYCGIFHVCVRACLCACVQACVLFARHQHMLLHSTASYKIR